MGGRKMRPEGSSKGMGSSQERKGGTVARGDAKEVGKTRTPRNRLRISGIA